MRHGLGATLDNDAELDLTGRLCGEGRGPDCDASGDEYDDDEAGRPSQRSWSGKIGLRGLS